MKFTSGPNGSISGRDAFAVLDRAGSAVLGDAEGGFSAPGTKPNDGYEFKGWDVDGDGAADVQDDALAALPVNGDMTITAVFDKGAAVQNVWSVTIVTNGGTTRVKAPMAKASATGCRRTATSSAGWMKAALPSTGTPPSPATRRSPRSTRPRPPAGDRRLFPRLPSAPAGGNHILHGPAARVFRAAAQNNNRRETL